MAFPTALEPGSARPEFLDREEALRLLATTQVGRVGTSAGALPVVLPVRFRLIGDRIVFRAVLGGALDAGTTGTVVAFQADSLGDGQRDSWSVVATGVARRVPDVDAPAVGELPSWGDPGAECVVAVSIELLTGQRLPTGPGGE